MKEILNLGPNVDSITIDGKTIVLVGTAHISDESVQLVEDTIRNIKPSSVAVELCESRYRSLKDQKRWREMDIFQVIRSGQTYVLMAQLALASFQKRIGAKLEIAPGADMMKAINVAEENNYKVHLADRDVKISLKRAWANTGFWSLFKLLGALLFSPVSAEKITKEEIEELKNTDVLTKMIEEFELYLPGVKTALIDERDSYLAAKILDSPGEKVVAVVGAGHVPGIKEKLGTEIDLEALERIPRSNKVIKYLTWAFPFVFLGLITYGFVSAGKDTGIELLTIWTLVNGVLAALGAIIALAHPITILTAFIAAPFTSLNPMIAAGFVCALIEAIIRKPRVNDLESIGEDILKIKSLWKNRVTRILLVFFFVNLGSSIGTIIGFTSMASKVL
jgi:pheromone shutdown-related protein TraB